MSFIEESDVQNLIESLLIKLFKDLLNVEVKSNFEKITFEEAMSKYGSDKPDTRIENYLQDITGIFANTEINFIKKLLEEGKVATAVAFEQEISKNFIKKLEESAKMQGATGLG
jgi:aspartyl-tRNA synthetase